MRNTGLRGTEGAAYALVVSRGSTISGPSYTSDVRYPSLQDIRDKHNNDQLTLQVVCKNKAGSMQTEDLSNHVVMLPSVANSMTDSDSFTG